MIKKSLKIFFYAFEKSVLNGSSDFIKNIDERFFQ